MKNKSLIERFKAQAGKVFTKASTTSLGHSLTSTSVNTMLGTGGADINVLEEYQGFAWKAINIRAKMLAKEDLFVERKVGDKWQPDINHEFNAVLEGEIGQPDLSDLLHMHEVHLSLYGESFWYFSKGEKSMKPVGIYILDPNCMTVMVANERVTGYVYQKNGDRVVLNIDELEHYFIADPRNPYRGYGPMQAAAWFIRSARYVNTYVNNFLENNAIPAGVIVAKGAVNDADWKLFTEQWSSKYSGIDNAGKTGFVRSGDLDFVKTGLSLGEVDFEKMKNTSRDDIMTMFGISKPMMAIFTDINRASAVTASRLFAATITEPELASIRRKLSKRVSKWYGAQFRIGSTNSMPEDEETKLNEYDKGVGRWFTVNEARAAYGLEAIAGGDVIDTAVKPVAPVAAKTIGKITVITKKKDSTGFSYEMKESFRGESEALQVKTETAVMQKASPLLMAQRDRVIAQLAPKKLLSAEFNPKAEAKALSDELLPILIELAAAQGQLAAAFVGSADTAFELTPVMEKYVADSITQAALGFSEETQAKIAQAITDGLNENESITKIGKRINSLYDEVLTGKTPGYRIERLARTEVVKTSNEITEAAYKQSSVVSKKEWFANPGKCEFCSSLNGSVVSLGATFVPLGATMEGTDGGSRVNSYEDVKHPPTHPGCRCTLIPVIEEL